MWTIPIDDKNSYFRDYLSLIKSTLDKEEAILLKKDEAIKNGETKPFTTDDGYYFDPSEELADMAYEIDEMGQLMYRTFVIGVFVFMESQINKTCEFVQSSKKQKFSYKELKGNGITRSTKYLKDVLEMEFPSLEARDDLEVARIVRNALVHNDGEVDESGVNKVAAYIAKYPDRLALDNSIISIMHPYAESLISLNQAICREVEEFHTIEEV
jgi:hypothetical protein